MLSREKRATLSPGLLGAREPGTPGGDDSASAEQPAAPAAAPNTPANTSERPKSQSEIARSVIRQLRGGARAEKERAVAQAEEEREAAVAAELSSSS